MSPPSWCDGKPRPVSRAGQRAKILFLRLVCRLRLALDGLDRNHLVADVGRHSERWNFIDGRLRLLLAFGLQLRELLLPLRQHGACMLLLSCPPTAFLEGK